MSYSLKEIVLSWVFVSIGGFAVWPPRAVYWDVLANRIGDSLTIAAVGVIAIILGAAFIWGTRIHWHSFSIGALIAYFSGMLGIEVVLSPDSPVHFLLYGGLLACFIIGAVLGSAQTGQLDLRALWVEN